MYQPGGKYPRGLYYKDGEGDEDEVWYKHTSGRWQLAADSVDDAEYRNGIDHILKESGMSGGMEIDIEKKPKANETAGPSGLDAGGYRGKSGGGKGAQKGGKQMKHKGERGGRGGDFQAMQHNDPVTQQILMTETLEHKARRQLIAYFNTESLKALKEELTDKIGHDLQAKAELARGSESEKKNAYDSMLRKKTIFTYISRLASCTDPNLRALTEHKNTDCEDETDNKNATRRVIERLANVGWTEFQKAVTAITHKPDKKDLHMLYNNGSSIGIQFFEDLIALSWELRKNKDTCANLYFSICCFRPTSLINAQKTALLNTRRERNAILANLKAKDPSKFYSWNDIEAHKRGREGDLGQDHSEGTSGKKRREY